MMAVFDETCFIGLCLMGCFDVLCGLTHRSHGLRAFCSYINLGFSGVFAFLPTNTSHSPTPLTLTTMSSSSAPASSPSSENLTNVKGLSSWELLQNHYQRIGSIHKYDYFSSVSFFFCYYFAFLIVLFQSSPLAVGFDAVRQDPSSVDDEVSGDRDWLDVELSL